MTTASARHAPATTRRIPRGNMSRQGWIDFMRAIRYGASKQGDHEGRPYGSTVRRGAPLWAPV